MELGFETIGNASIVCHDRRPILVTDPWLDGSAYFGSWILSHQVPPEQLEAIRGCEYVWYSHGHPDHLNAASFDHIRGAKILVPDHYGHRIFRDLQAQGLDVHVVPDRTWIAALGPDPDPVHLGLQPGCRAADRHRRLPADRSQRRARPRLGSARAQDRRRLLSGRSCSP